MDNLVDPVLLARTDEVRQIGDIAQNENEAFVVLGIEDPEQMRSIRVYIEGHYLMAVFEQKSGDERTNKTIASGYQVSFHVHLSAKFALIYCRYVHARPFLCR